MEKKLEIIQGDNEPDPLDRILQLGGAVVGFTKKSVRFGIIMVAETGSAVMYISGQKKYAQDLKQREPKDRIVREAKTAKRALTKKVPDLELGDFAVKYITSGIRALTKRDLNEVQDSTPVVVDLIEALPDTQEGIAIAEDITMQCFEPIVTEFNNSIIEFRSDFPTQRPPSE